MSGSLLIEESAPRGYGGEENVADRVADSLLEGVVEGDARLHRQVAGGTSAHHSRICT